MNVLTLGQYLRPSAQHLPVARYYHPDEFRELGEIGRALGFAHVESGPLVRSSYHAKRRPREASERWSSSRSCWSSRWRRAWAGALLGIPSLIAPRRVTAIKMEPFECGKDPVALPEGRFAIKFSTIAIFFIIFDIELLFVWPWATLYSPAGAGSASWR